MICTKSQNLPGAPVPETYLWKDRLPFTLAPQPSEHRLGRKLKYVGLKTLYELILLTNPSRVRSRSANRIHLVSFSVDFQVG